MISVSKHVFAVRIGCNPWWIDLTACESQTWFAKVPILPVNNQFGPFYVPIWIMSLGLETCVYVIRGHQRHVGIRVRVLFVVPESPVSVVRGLIAMPKATEYIG